MRFAVLDGTDCRTARGGVVRPGEEKGVAHVYIPNVCGRPEDLEGL